MTIKFLLGLTTFLPVFLFVSQPIFAQNITNVHVESCNCAHLNISASIDPVSSTYTFYWVLLIGNKETVDLALIGLNGNGVVLLRDEGSIYNYTVKNHPSFLPNGNNKFTSLLTFMFPDNKAESLIFGTVSTPLDIRIPHPVFDPRCNETMDDQGYARNVSCYDGSRDCFCSKNNISGYVTCNNENITVLCNANGGDSCLVKPEFHFIACPSRCDETIYYQGYPLNVSCSDGSRDCFCSTNTSSGYVICSGKYTTAFCTSNGADRCSVKPEFRLSSCPSRCSDTIDYQGYPQNVFCSDGSKDCFCTNSNISGYLTCNDENITAHCNANGADICSVKPKFNFSSCLSRCNEATYYQGYRQNIFCSDGSKDCFCGNSNISGYVTCNDENITAFCNTNAADSCLVKPEFNFSSCPSRCSETICYQGDLLDVFCSDNSSDCFCSNSNISGYVTYNEENITVFCSTNGADICSVKPQFNISSCPAGCSNTITYQGHRHNVFCSDGSRDCFCSGKNIPGYVTCNDENITAFCSTNGADSCLVKPEFNFSSCMSRCSDSIIYQGQRHNVFCSDGSRDCFCSGINIPGYVTCNDENITAFCSTNGADSCLVKPEFNFSSCMSRCSDTIYYQGYAQIVFCSDSSRDCFCSGSNIPGYVTCNEENITAFCSIYGADSCLVKPEFNFSSCSSRCSDTINYKGYSQNVFCSGGSRDCFCSNSNISGYVTCNEENITVVCGTNGADSCLVKSEFNFSSCPSNPFKRLCKCDNCQRKLVTIALVAGGILVLISIILYLLKKYFSIKKLHWYDCFFLGIGIIFFGIGVLCYEPCITGFLVGGILLILFGSVFIALTVKKLYFNKPKKPRGDGDTEKNSKKTEREYELVQSPPK